MSSPVAPKSVLSTASHRPASLDRRYVGNFVDHLFGASLHKKRLESLANSVVGVLHAAVLAIHAIGAAYAAVAQKQAKHGIKQVDRWLSNTGFEVARLWSSWVDFVVGVREEIVVALDGTNFESEARACTQGFPRNLGDPDTSTERWNCREERTSGAGAPGSRSAS
jgi:hypothetical protein